MDNKVKAKADESISNKSKLKRKSIGYAGANLELDTKMLEVYPVEEYGYTDGEINDTRESIEETGVDAQGNSYSDKIETSNTIVAEWLQWGSNRYSPPNIRRGERVILWQYADADKYYWTAMGMDDHLRRRETAIYNFSNTTDESTKEINSTNSYSIIISTHTKEITIQTTKTDGEEFAYIVKLDTKSGMFVITDDINNQITLESKEKRITLVNASGSSVVIDKKNIKIDAIDTIDINAKSVNINASIHNINASTTTNTSGKYSLVGEVQMTGTVTNNGINISSTHTHGGVKSGSSSSSTPN